MKQPWLKKINVPIIFGASFDAESLLWMNLICLYKSLSMLELPWVLGTCLGTKLPLTKITAYYELFSQVVMVYVYFNLKQLEYDEMNLYSCGVMPLNCV